MKRMRATQKRSRHLVNVEELEKANQNERNNIGIRMKREKNMRDME